MVYSKAFPLKDGTVYMRCPVCKVVKNIPHDKLPLNRKFSVKCNCGTVFKVQIESRKTYRKDIDFDCIIQLMEQDNYRGKDQSESHETKIKPLKCRIINLSLGGLGLKVVENIRLNKDDRILVKFNFDNPASTRIEKKQ